MFTCPAGTSTGGLLALLSLLSLFCESVATGGGLVTVAAAAAAAVGLPSVRAFLVGDSDAWLLAALFCYAVLEVESF